LQEEQEEEYEEELEELEEKVQQGLSDLQTLLDEFIIIIKKMKMAEKLFNTLKDELQEKKNNKNS